MSEDDPNHSEKLLHLITLSKMMSSCKANTAETKAMMAIVEGSSNILKSISELLFAIKSKKKISEELINSCVCATETARDDLAQYVDLKTDKMREFLDYFRSLNMEIPEENKKLNEFVSEWENLKLKINNFNVAKFQNSRNMKNEIQNFQNELENESKTLLNKLEKLEETVFRDIRNMITFNLGNSFSPEMKNLLLKP